VSAPHATGRFFAASRALFGAAARTAGTSERSYRIAGQDVLVRFAGAELVERTDPALGAVSGATTPTAPALTVEMWDSATSGVPMPRPPWSPDDLRPLGLVRPYCDDRFHTAVDVHTASLSLLDTTNRTAQFWLHDARRMAYWQSASPLRLILSWWASSLGMQLTHAAAVGSRGDAVLLVGGAGAGKSTTSLACLSAGFDFFGDDYCLIEPGPAPRVHRVYATAKLHSDALSLLPSSIGTVRNGSRLAREKAILDVPAPAATERTAARISAIVAPCVTGRVSVAPISAGASLRAMAPSTIFGLFGATPTSLRRLASVASEVPSYRLELGTDVDRVIDAVSSLVGAP